MFPIKTLIHPLSKTQPLPNSPLNSPNPINNQPHHPPPQPFSLSSLLSLEPNLSSTKWPLSPPSSSKSPQLSPNPNLQPQFLSILSLPPPKEILSLFTTLQTQLFEAVAQLQEILDLQDAKKKIARDIRSKDSVMLSFANKLKESECVLDMLVDDYSDYRKPKRSKFEEDLSATTIYTCLKLPDILSYVHKISYTTFAPSEFGTGMALLHGALPLAPQDEQMRASQLYLFANLDIGLPDMENKLIEPMMEIRDIPGIIPPTIVVPSGWKPGMPVELLSDFPILPPAGWKPRDPVSLPPLDGLAVPGRSTE